MENIKLKVLTEAQYQFLSSKEPAGYYDDRTRAQIYSLVERLQTNKKACCKEEHRLREIFHDAELGVLLPPGQETSGPLKFKPSLCVNGNHQGDITTNGTLIINDQGSVHGNVQAEEVICKGHLAGNVKAGRRFTVASSGRVIGDVVALAVQVAPGALFRGKCKLGGGAAPMGTIRKKPASKRNRISRLFKTG